MLGVYCACIDRRLVGSKFLSIVEITRRKVGHVAGWPYESKDCVAYWFLKKIVLSMSLKQRYIVNEKFKIICRPTF